MSKLTDISRSSDTAVRDAETEQETTTHELRHSVRRSPECEVSEGSSRWIDLLTGHKYR